MGFHRRPTVLEKGVVLAREREAILDHDIGQLPIAGGADGATPSRRRLKSKVPRDMTMACRET